MQLFDLAGQPFPWCGRGYRNDFGFSGVGMLLVGRFGRQLDFNDFRNEWQRFWNGHLFHCGQYVDQCSNGNCDGGGTDFLGYTGGNSVQLFDRSASALSCCRS